MTIILPNGSLKKYYILILIAKNDNSWSLMMIITDNCVNDLIQKV